MDVLRQTRSEESMDPVLLSCLISDRGTSYYGSVLSIRDKRLALRRTQCVLHRDLTLISFRDDPRDVPEAVAPVR